MMVALATVLLVNALPCFLKDVEVRLLCLIGLLIAVPASGEAGAGGRSEIIDFYTGNQLYDFCKRGSPACVGYILGVAAAHNGKSFCFPAGVIGEQVVGTVKLWLESHPKKRHAAGGRLVVEALSGTFLALRREDQLCRFPGLTRRPEPLKPLPVQASRFSVARCRDPHLAPSHSVLHLIQARITQIYF